MRFRSAAPPSRQPSLGHPEQTRTCGLPVTTSAAVTAPIEAPAARASARVDRPGELQLSIDRTRRRRPGRAASLYFLAATGSTVTATACVYTASIWSPTLISLSCAGSST